MPGPVKFYIIDNKARNLESWYFCDFVVKMLELEKCELDTNSENSIAWLDKRKITPFSSKHATDKLVNRFFQPETDNFRYNNLITEEENFE